jgi:hypothetical protein
MNEHLHRRGIGSAFALGCAIAGFSGCSASPAPTAAPPVDCSVEAAWDLPTVENYEAGGNSYNAPWFSFADTTPGAVLTSAISGPMHGQLPTLPIEGDGVCGKKRALVLVSAGHNDYGSGFGSYCLANNYFMLTGTTTVITPMGPMEQPTTLYPCTAQDATGYEGIAFWARNPPMHLDHVPGQFLTHVRFDAAVPDADIPPEAGYTDFGPDATAVRAEEVFGTPQGPFDPSATTPGVTVYFDDAHTSEIAFNYNQTARSLKVPEMVIPNSCDRASVSMGSCVTTLDPNTGTTTMAGSGCVPLPNQCGNSYTRTLQLTHEWQLYLLPFTSFKQDLLPNRSTLPQDLAHVFTFGVRLPKEAVAEIWITNLGFYRKKQ